jgi:DNA repair exonuclease SbcCD nuclease subunit
MSITSVLVIGDVHIKNNNIPGVEILHDKIRKLLKERVPNIIVILGDILHYHEKIDSAQMNVAYNFIRMLKSFCPVYILVGNHDMCLGKDIPILQWNGSTKLSQNIQKGDNLVGDDGLPRKVLTTCSGKNNMYLVHQTNGEDYTVTENHILSLKCGFHKSIFWNKTKNSWTVKWIDRENMKLRSKFFSTKFRDPQNYTKYFTRTIDEAKVDAEKFLDDIYEIDTLDITIRDYLQVPENVRKRLYGFRGGQVQWNAQDVIIDPYILGMWLGDGSKDGSGFTSADAILIKEWWEWGYKNRAEIVHTGQYNYGIRNSNYKNPNITKLDICHPDHNCKTCRACLLHVTKYKRAPSIICASLEELSHLLNNNREMIEFFSQGASREQLLVLNDRDVIRGLLEWKKTTRNRKDDSRPFPHYSSPLRKMLKNYDLYRNKHIPKEYLLNDENTRLELLAGFVDTDGTVVGGRNILISQGGNNIHMIDELHTLAKSLGFSSTKSKICLNSGMGIHFQTLYISGDVERIPTRLPRKKCNPIMNKGYDRRGRKCADKSRTSISVRSIGMKDYYGFSVDGNNRFLLGDFTVTHNCNNQQFLTDNHWMNGMKEWENVTIVDKVIKVDNFVLLPFVPPGRFEEALNTLDEEWKDVSAIFCHQEFLGCKMGAIESTEGDKWPLDYPEIISGHIHDKQKPQKNIYYTGSCMQHAFGESHNKTIAWLSFCDNECGYSTEEICLNLPKKKIVYLDVGDLEDYDIPETEDMLRLTVSGNCEEFKAFKKTKKYQQMTKKGVKVFYQPVKIKEEKEHRNVEDFLTILDDMVSKENNSDLYSAYNHIFHGRDRDEIYFFNNNSSE